MLANSTVAPALPVEDLSRARKFYEDKLGFKPMEASSSGVLYRCGKGTCLFLYEAKNTKTEHVLAVFEVDNLQREVKELVDKGVVMEGNKLPEVSTLDDLTSVPTGDIVCFKDSEGNILAIAQVGMLLELKGEVLPFRR